LLTLVVGCQESSSAPLVPALGEGTYSPRGLTATTNDADRVQVASATESPAIQGFYTDQRVFKPVVAETVEGVPPVLLTSAHAKLCRVFVGDPMPEIKLPVLSGKPTALVSLYGRRATIVLFWRNDRWMARAALSDLGRDLVDRIDDKRAALIGIPVGEDKSIVEAAIRDAGAEFPQLLDTDGDAFAKVGIVALPRIYVLDGEGQIVWFDIEYSEATRRELRQTLDVLLPVEHMAADR
jgi:peroxiredoxin